MFLSDFPCLLGESELGSHKKAWFWCFMKKEDGFFHKIRQSRSLCIIVEVRKLWAGNAGREEFTIKAQLLGSPTQGRINGRLCEEVDLLAKTTAFCWAENDWIRGGKQEKRIIIYNVFAFKVSTPVTEIRTFSYCRNKCLDQDHTRFSFYRTITFSSSTHQFAALLLYKAISILPSDDFLETIFMKAVAIWFAISSSEREQAEKQKWLISHTVCDALVSWTRLRCDLHTEIRRGSQRLLCKRGWKTCWFYASANKLMLVWNWKLCCFWLVGGWTFKGSSVSSATFEFYSY